MTDVACFCGCSFSFAGEIGMCPRCGEGVTLTLAAAADAAEMRTELEALLAGPREDRAAVGALGPGSEA
ncbi:MAG: hypothetical protein WAL63_05910 [Solirubrobacteraceae bacterium]